jgi:hypothetical protein
MTSRTGKHIFPGPTPVEPQITDRHRQLTPAGRKASAAKEPKIVKQPEKPQPASQKPDPEPQWESRRPRTRSTRGRTAAEVAAALASNEAMIDLPSAARDLGLSFKFLIEAVSSGTLAAAEVDASSGKVLFRRSDIQKLKESA